MANTQAGKQAGKLPSTTFSFFSQSLSRQQLSKRAKDVTRMHKKVEKMSRSILFPS